MAQHLPDSAQKLLRREGFQKAGEGLWRKGRERWVVAQVQAPQSWERMLAPLLAEAILESSARAVSAKAKPLAVLVSPRLSGAMHERLRSFAERVAPDVAWMACDKVGQVFAHFPGKPPLIAALDRPEVQAAGRLARPIGLFSGLHQWMLKVLLAPAFEERLLHAPRDRLIRNARVLAQVAQVSVPAAARFVRALEASGHLERRFGDLRVWEPLRLLESWRAAVSLSHVMQAAARFVRGPLGDDELGRLILVANQMAPNRDWRAVLGLFSACQSLGLQHVKGAPRHLYVSSIEPERLERLGLMVVAPEEQSDLLLRVPRYPSAIFRAAAERNGWPLATDVIQCWLDVSHHPARGAEQAQFLWRKVLAPALEQR